MGCGGSKGGPGKGGRPATKAGAASKKPPSAGSDEKRKLLNPEDFVVSKRTGELIIRDEGSIDGQQFNIEECKDCDIFLLDRIACVFVDDCEGCRIFIGPVESSVMIRNCKAMNFVIACQQFRTRDCSDCRFSLLCTTEPIIETSTQMQFACFDFCYFSLRAQLTQAGLNVWNNKWWLVYDFNKNPDRPNWSLLSQDEVPQLLRIERCSSIAPDELTMERVVPLTLGSRPWPCEETCFAVFLPGADAYVDAFLARVEKTPGWELCRTRSTLLAEDRLKSLLSWTKESKLAGQCRGREVTGVQICGPGVFGQAREALTTTGLAAGCKMIRLVPEAEATALGKAFFEVWKDEV